MDEPSKLRALLEACHRVIAQLEKLRVGEDNPFPKRIRETCRGIQDRLRKLEPSATSERPDQASIVGGEPFVGVEFKSAGQYAKT